MAARLFSVDVPRSSEDLTVQAQRVPLSHLDDRQRAPDPRVGKSLPASPVEVHPVQNPTYVTQEGHLGVAERPAVETEAMFEELTEPLRVVEGRSHLVVADDT